MRPTRILTAAALALGMVTPAHASPGVCADSSVVVTGGVCVPPFVTCQRGDAVTVVTIGIGTGSARCGDAAAYCTATGACTRSDSVFFGGVLECDVDQYGDFEAIAICFVAPASAQVR